MRDVQRLPRKQLGGRPEGRQSKRPSSRTAATGGTADTRGSNPRALTGVRVRIPGGGRAGTGRQDGSTRAEPLPVPNP
ncbi:MAG: hypothetical protein K0S70_234, partial [Microbacterium sp.]|nr:hypothetical protein [Microbacterium sp.]